MILLSTGLRSVSAQHDIHDLGDDGFLSPLDLQVYGPMMDDKNAAAVAAFERDWQRRVEE